MEEKYVWTVVYSSYSIDNGDSLDFNVSAKIFLNLNDAKEYAKTIAHDTFYISDYLSCEESYEDNEYYMSGISANNIKTCVLIKIIRNSNNL